VASDSPSEDHQKSPETQKALTMSKIIRSLKKATLATFAVSAMALAAGEAQAQGWINPEIYNSGRRVTDARYDPFTGQIIVRTDQTKVRESYLDPNRDQIDPGSYRRVNRYETDLNGVRWHITGTQWTSNGVPHGNLSRRRVVSGGGGVVEDRNEHVAFGVPSSASTSNSKSNAAKRNTGFNSSRYQSSKPAASKPRSNQQTQTRNLRRYSPF
jgi:hypothetical protein